ncbi:MAG: hypothetical protein IJH63_10165 [Methanobrevibacter sp.]|nr:hypothetical protein [Methanosphaera sp.]MBR0371063.1 hypothetical protein [Methanobrevibacter sp.]
MSEDKEVSFDRFLLFHPQDRLTYIRKLTMSYGYYTALAVVDSNNRVTDIGVSNSFQIVSFKDLSEDDRDILGVERCSRLEPEDLLSVYRINKALKLTYHYRLWNPCRNMRYTTPEETYELKNLMKYTLSNENLMFTEENNHEYNTAYSDYVELDLENIDLSSTLEDISLPNFNTVGATGQTRLI